MCKPILVISFGLDQAEEQVIFDYDVTCVSESTMVGLTACGGGGVGVGTRACCVAADKMDSNFSIRSIRSIFPLAKISSTICIDSANETGPLPKYPIFEEKLREKNAENLPVTLGESVDLGVPAPPGDPSGRGDRLDSGEAGLCSLTLEPKDSKLG